MAIFTTVCWHGNSLQYTHMNGKQIPGVLLIFTVNARSLTRSLPALQIGILQDTENGCDVVFVLFFRLPPNLDSGLTS